jgi:hypothetical protein
MKKLEAIYTLVHSLSKSEQRLFYLNSQVHEGEKVYFELYEIIRNKPLSQCEELFYERFPSKNLDQAVKHLQHSLLKTIRNIHAKKNLEQNLAIMIQNISILFERGCYTICLQELQQAKMLAQQHQKNLQYAQLCIKEVEISSFLNYQSFAEKDINQILQQGIQSLEESMMIYKHSLLFHSLQLRYQRNGYTRSEEEKSKLHDLLLEEFHLNAGSNFKSFEKEKYRLLFQSAYFLMVSSPKSGLKVLNELLELFEKNNFLWLENPIHFLYLINSMLYEQYILAELPELSTILQKVNSFKSESYAVNSLVNIISTKYQLLYAFQHNNNTDMETQLLAIENNHIAQKNTSLFILELFQVAAICYYKLGKFRNALAFVNRLLSAENEHISSQMKSMTNILLIFIHLAIKNNDYAEYEIRNLERKLKKYKAYYGLENACISYFKKAIKNDPLAESSFKNDLQKLKEIPTEARLIKQLPFVSI